MIGELAQASRQSQSTNEISKKITHPLLGTMIIETSMMNFSPLNQLL